MFTPGTEAALFPASPVVVLVSLLVLVDVDSLACWLTTATDTPGLVTHSELLSSSALERKVMSAH